MPQTKKKTAKKEDSPPSVEDLTPLSEVIPELKGGVDAQLEYERLLPELRKLGHLTELNRQSLVNYVEAFSMACDALDYMKDDGIVLENDEKMTRYMHPAFGIWSAARKTMNEEAINLGMTPKSLKELKEIGSAREKGKKGKPDGPSAFLQRK